MSSSPSTNAGYQELDRSPAYQLWLVTNAWQRRVRRALEPLGLTHVQFLILASVDILSAREETVTQAAVSRFAAIDENMTSQVIRTLEQHGLLQRNPHPSDARARSLALTGEGAEQVRVAREHLRPAKEEMFRCLGDDLPQFTSLLARVADAEQE